MKKQGHTILLKALITVFLLLTTIFAFADYVDVIKAKRVALNLHAGRSGDVLKSPTIARVIENRENGETVFYVIEYHPKGFAIISADDCVQPVLGYSFESGYDENDMPPAFEFYILTRLRKQIYAARKAGVEPDQETTLEWQRLLVDPDNFSSKEVKSFVPLLSTTWGQGTFYNSHCPPDTAGPDGHALVGCVGVAMAQVLNYWEHPWKGTGSHTYTHPDYGTQTANFGNSVYNFDNMPDTATTYHDDLAQLMYHCAVSVDMDFGPDGSGAWGWGNSDVSNALKDYFYFNSGADDITRSSYSATWVDKMKEDLDLNRPVIYGARDNQQDAGHAWVLDAYTTGDMFHCNWGWYGNFNGFYSIDDFSVDGYTFDVWEHACVKIRPKTANLNGTWDLAGSPYHIYYNHIVDPGDQLIIEPGVEVFFEGRYKLEVQGRLEAVGTPADTIFFHVSDPVIGSRGIRFINLNDYAADSSKLAYCRIDNGYGNYLQVMGLGSTYGGAVYCENSSRVLLEHNRVYGGNAGYGGGIACIDTSDIRIKNCVIESCEALMGGGLYLSESSPMISYNVFRNNQAFSNGGGVYCNYNSPAHFYRDTICNNASLYGGGIGLSSSDAVFDEVVIHSNDVVYMGGGMYLTESGAYVNQSKIYSNTAVPGVGGGILCHSNSDMVIERSLIFSNNADTSSALYIIGSHPSLFHTTVAHNLAAPFQPAIQVAWGGLDIENSILWNNGSGRIDTAGSAFVAVQYSIMEDTAYTGAGVLHQDPLFVSPVNANYQLKWPGFPLPDEGKSPAIDGGNPASPPDPDGTRADMGPFPFEQTFTPLPGGDISGVLTCAGSPYYVDGDLMVPQGDELVIEPCVSLIFRGNFALEVRGRLLAEGTHADRINFAPSDTVTGWKGIRFYNTESNSQDSSVLRHCRVTFGRGNPAVQYKGGALLFTSSGDVLVENCLLNKNRVTNQGGAVYIHGSNGPLLVNNTIENNRALSGGGVFGIYTQINLSGNTIQNNTAEYGGAVHIHTSHFNSAGDVFRHNWADLYGGGLYFEAHGSCTFDPVNKSNIYLNYAGAAGLDLFYTGNMANIKHVVVDTFTVQYINKHFVYPTQSFTMNMSNHVVDQMAGDLYVSPTGSDSNSGTSSSAPLKTMHMACMKILAEEANPRSIWLAEGTYSEGATGEVFPVNWRSYVSMKGAGIDVTVIDGEDKNHLLFCYDDTGFSIDSITFREGYGQHGGAIRLEEGSSPAISNVLVTENQATKTGGGIYCKESSPYIYDATISHNYAHEYGGGIMASSSDPTILKALIAHNSTIYGGGGIYATLYSDVTLDSLTIYKNTAANGGGLCFFFVCNGTISNTLIQENQAPSQGGYNGTGGGVYISYSSSPDFYNTQVLYNEADYRAGGIYASGAIASTFSNCLVEGNSANSGGGLYVGGGSSGTTRFYNAIISNNSSLNGHGGGVYLDGGNQAFYNATITGNAANGWGQGGAVHNQNSNSLFASSILWGNTPNEINVAGGSVSAEYCNVEGSYPGAGNIDSDPVFIYGSHGPYHLSSSSPCIDAGNPDTTGMSLPVYDFAGNLRIANDTVDMGAIEYQSTAAISLDLKVFLEGPFNGSEMNTDLIGLTEFPLSQPYHIVPWNYTGAEAVAAIPGTDVVDWVLIELRDAPDAASAGSAAVVARQAAFLMRNGSVRGLNGTSLLFFNETVTYSLYAIIWHRSHIGVMSAAPLTKTGGVYSCDFTNDASQAYGGTQGHKEIAPGIWGMIGADGNADGQINNADKNDVWAMQAGASGYRTGDFNLDSQVNNNDKNDVWAPNTGLGGQVPE
ncbi:MAG: C10 family peptidase [Bacteroidales bacterium]|nr:C10 family peptidase [Bacteroidales bacterium]